jgi:hypothetical protein
MRRAHGFAATVAVTLGCAGSARPASPPPPEAELSPVALCAKVAALLAREDPAVKMPCDCFARLYEAMRGDNPASYACTSRCVKDADDLQAMKACEDRNRCEEQTSTPKTAVPADARVTSYCRKMVAIDDSRPHLGMHACVVLASWATGAQFACMYSCAMEAASQAEYQACIRRNPSCGAARVGTALP